MSAAIKHIWFDFSDTLAIPSKEHKKLLYETYATAVGRTLSPEIEQEFKSQLKKHKSNSAVFASLGLPSGYWSGVVNSKDPATLYTLADKNIPKVLDQLRRIVPISIFSNMQMDILLPAIGLDPRWFKKFLSSAQLKNPKPALDGFYKIIEMSELPPENILFVGDSVEKEVLPAKKVGIITGLMWNSSPEADYSFANFEDILEVFEKI